MKILQERIKERVAELKEKKLQKRHDCKYTTPEKTAFLLGGGRKLTSLFELVDELETMSQQEFGQFVSPLKNDFANWIRDVFVMPTLAEEVRRSASTTELQRVVLKQMARDLRDVCHTK
jgi:hypothetical protein